MSRLAVSYSKLTDQCETPTLAFDGPLGLEVTFGVSVVLLHKSTSRVTVIITVLLASPNLGYKYIFCPAPVACP
jgi:hypothetical protein